jgi:osmotically-inducible protein OsmY
MEAARSGAAPERPAPNDQALAERVKSEVFQPTDAPKDSVVISAENGIVYLRGEAPNVRTLKKIAKKTEKVDGVREVENLLHLPKTPAPTRS